jgi:hypothetical protein
MRRRLEGLLQGPGLGASVSAWANEVASVCAERRVTAGDDGLPRAVSLSGVGSVAKALEAAVVARVAAEGDGAALARALCELRMLRDALEERERQRYETQAEVQRVWASEHARHHGSKVDGAPNGRANGGLQ